jgi:hypothetical protein
MRAGLLIFALLISSLHAEEPFVQGPIRIVPPVHQEEGEHRTVKANLFNDGGTKMAKITDAEGKTFEIYIDHRIGSKTPGAIYLIDYPGTRKSVRVMNEGDFRHKIRLPSALE